MFSLIRSFSRGGLESINTAAGSFEADEIEAALLAHPGVAAAAVVGLPCQQGAEKSEQVACMIQVGEGWTWRDEGAGYSASAKTLDLESIQDHCLQRGVLDFKLPRIAWGSGAALPQNALGNVLKEIVKERLLDLTASLHEHGGSIELNPLFKNSHIQSNENSSCILGE